MGVSMVGPVKPLLRRLFRLADVQPVRTGLPLLLLALVARGGRARGPAAGGLVGFWAWVWALYRREARRETAREVERFRTVDAVSFKRHYDEKVPTVEEEFALW